MRLYEKLPDSVTVNGKRIKLNLDFRNVLRMIDLLHNDNLMIEAREYLAVNCICRHPKKGMIREMLKEVRKLIFPEQEFQEEWHQRIMDFEQDSEMIIAAFRQVYGINLLKDRLQWFEFSALLSNLPSGNRFSEVLGIRARPMPPATDYNTEERMWLAKAKLQYAIRYSEEEEQEMFKKSLSGLGKAFSVMSKGGDGT